MVSLGTERLVGTRYGPNVPLAFDGGRAILRGGHLTVNALYVRPVEPGLHDLDDRTSASRALWGVYATRMLKVGEGSGLDVYYLGYRNDRAVFDQGAGRELRHTFGVRSFGRVREWHWNIEAMAQFGRFAGGDIRAWSVGSEVGRRFSNVPLSPDVTVRFNVVSGDHDRRDRDLGTFNALFPKGKYFGELSPVGPYNIVNLHPGVSLDLGHNISADLVGMFYWRQSIGDGIYDVPGHLLRSGQGTSARFIGKEVEGSVAWQATPELEISASLSAFEPGGFIRESGPARVIRMVGLESNFRF
jgi:hypothetical protein